MQQRLPLFTNCTAALAYIDPEYILGKLTDWQGDYEFSYLEQIEHLGGPEDEQKYRVRLAPVHIHIGTVMHVLELTPTQSASMVHVKYELNENFLASRSMLFPHPPASMKGMDVVYVEPLWQPSDKNLVARVAPVTLHIDGAFSEAIIREDQRQWGYPIPGLPLQHKPQAMHTCRQRNLLGVLDSFDGQKRL